MPQVSVIIPSFNHATFIEQAIASVLNQAWNDWEIIIVDDGSTDNTRFIIGNITDTRIHYIYQHNQGLASARNTGIHLATGKYLAFLDADDQWHPLFLRKCISVLQQNPESIGVYTGFSFIDEKGKILQQAIKSAISPGHLYYKLLHGGFFPPCTVVIQRNIVEHLGMFDIDLMGNGTEDWDLWLRVSKNYSITSVPECLAYYRVYPGSMSTNAAKMHACRLSVLVKHFGLPEDDPEGWPKEKRLAYGYAHRSAALDFIAQHQPDKGWQWLTKGIYSYPQLLMDLSTFYELACGDQPRGYRGQAELLDIERNGAEMLRRLDGLFRNTQPAVQAMREIAYGNAYLALAMLSDQAGQWREARRYLLRAFKYNPKLISLLHLRRLTKFYVGKRVANSWQALRTRHIPLRFMPSSVKPNVGID